MHTVDQWYYLCITEPRQARLLARNLRVETNFINSLGKLPEAHVYASCRGWPVCTDFYFSPGAATLAIALGAMPCDSPSDGEAGRDLHDPEAPPLLR